MKRLILPAIAVAVAAVLLYAQGTTAPTMFPPVRGTQYMVGAANNFEVEAGVRLLSQGGNAVDAGAASVLAAAVTEQSRFGLGGEMPILIKMAGKPVLSVGGIGIAPAKATVEYFQKRQPESWEDANKMAPIPMQGIHSAITPGAFDGVILALQQFGTKSFAEVAQPAIELAGQGFPMPEEFGNMLRGYKKILSLWPDSDRFFYPDGVLVKRGEVFREPLLAATLNELVAAEKKAKGPRIAKLQAVRDLFYKGSIAHRIGDWNAKNDGLIAYEDMVKTKATIEPTTMGTYRGYEIHKPGFWSQGPVMIEALNILEGFDLKSMGHNSPEYLHTVVEAVKLAFADRDAYYGDPRFSKIPEDILLSKEYAAERRKLIDPKSASMESRPGEAGPKPPLPTISQPADGAVNDTTSVDVVDHMGNAFSATPSGAWLPSVIMGDTGIPLTTRLQAFVLTPGHANQLMPGKRPRVTLSPTLVTKAGQFVMELSTPGGDNQDQALLQTLLNVIDFNMQAQEAVEAPRFQTEHFYSSFGAHEFVPGRLSLENRIPRATIEGLAALGHKVNITGEWSNGSAPVLIIKQGEVLNGGADIRRARYVFGR